ncbi:MAG TPA: hypothetical protein VHA73_03870 [Acidimicrobiales bacterium]|jgi:hypothetical protein|nr:hypothetical protein [Acidimicrobiales bacterium]
MADDPVTDDAPGADDQPRAWPHRPPPSPPHEHRPDAFIPEHPNAPPAAAPIWVGSAPDWTPPPPAEPLPGPPPAIAPPPAPRVPEPAPTRPRRPRPDPRPGGPSVSGSVLLGAVLVILAGVALVVAAFLPWVVGTGIEVDGWHATSDAKFLLGAGIVALAVGSLIVGSVPVRWPRVLIFVGAAATLALAASDIVDASHVANVQVPSPHAGSGPWLALVAGAVLLASLWFVRARPSVERERAGTHPERTEVAG